jgi:diaminopimelate epimerase
VQWGLVPAKAEDVLVHMDGGDVRVRVNVPKTGHVTLIGPAEFMQSAQVELIL